MSVARGKLERLETKYFYLCKKRNKNKISKDDFKKEMKKIYSEVLSIERDYNLLVDSWFKVVGLKFRTRISLNTDGKII